ncbi:MAG: glycosyl hydrolase, partial [Acidobacteria bacterium]|nr:glycosyl hydrolase [Acidobacteriota bacterium]
MRLFAKITLFLLLILPMLGQETKQQDPMSSGTFNALRFRSIGPATTSGRIAAIAVDPHDRSHIWVGAASGGVWKSMNAGTTWTPVFDSQGSYSIGAVTIDPKNPSTVWVGAGENNSQRSVSYGDGVYRTDDGGRTWRNVGLRKSEHIGRILIDPRDSDVVYVASQGPLWGPGGDRGLYKTADGGKTWNNILTISENTGITEVLLDPRNPDVLYAAAYQRRRHIWTLIDGGPESGIHKSTDAGKTWTRLRSGLPNVDLGRIGMTISPADPDVLYAQIEAAERRGGVFRSIDRGATWERMNPFDATAMYYGKIVADPKDVDRVYIPNTNMMVSDDGGRTVRQLGERAKHVDNHAMWIDPNDTRYLLVGCDGGLYQSFDRGQTWVFMPNLPITQFYDITVDNATPFYHVYGGTQDNFSLGGPSRTRSVSGIVNSDWFVTNGGDGFRSHVDPEDPNIVYAESQNGGLVRFDKRTGERVSIRPPAGKGEETMRTNWDTPFMISPHSRARLYYAGNKLYKSENRGDDWQLISPDLTRQLDRNALPVMGKIWGPEAVAKHASTALYGNASTLAESPKKDGLIYVGTDDGLIQVTENAGETWRKIETFPGVPERTYVSEVIASQHAVNTVYAAFDNHQMSDFTPYILKSSDNGRTWVSIRGNLPDNGAVLAIAEDHVSPDLLFVGTEFGVFFSINGDERWVQLRGGMPTIAAKDLAIQKRENDLVVGSFGRGVYILDDYSPLRQIKPDTLTQEAVTFPPKDALMFVQSSPLGGRGKGFQGETFFTANNPAFGATFTYYLKESLQTKRQKRQAAEREAERRGQTPPYPTREQLQAEQDEEPPAVIVSVMDAEGNLIRRLEGPTGAGLQRVTWDLRHPAPTLAAGGGDDDDGPGGGPSGHLVMPGRYSFSIATRVDGVPKPVSTRQSLNVVAEGTAGMTQADRTALAEFQQKLARLQRAVSGASSAASALRTRLTAIRRALNETPSAPQRLTEDSMALEKRNNAIIAAISGGRATSDTPPPSISQRANSIAGRQVMAATRPTQTQIQQYNIAEEEFRVELAKLRT